MKKKLSKNRKISEIVSSEVISSDTYMFSPYEEKLLTILDFDGRAPTEIRRLSSIPHASMYLAFQKLCKRGFAEKRKVGKKVIWKKITQNKPVYQKESDMSGFSSIHIYKTRDEIRSRILQVKDMPIGSKLYTIEGTQSAIGDGWDKYFSTEETIEINNTLSKRKIICESIIPKNYFDLHSPRLGNEWEESYKQRPLLTHMLNTDIINSDTNIYMSDNFLLIFHGVEGVLLEVKNREICKLFIQMFKAIIKK